MVAVFAYALTLLVAVLLSGVAHRTVLSTAAIFLVAGFLVGHGGGGWLDLDARDATVQRFVEIVLFAVLFTDGMLIGIRDARSAWRLPGRALFLGLPLTLAATAALAHFMVGLPWVESLLLGAALAPTDPVLAAAIVGREEVPARVRRLLNLESGLNDGLALPIVIILIAAAGHNEFRVGSIAADVTLGVVIGIAVPLAATYVARLPFLSSTTRYEPLNAVAIGLLVLSLAVITHANEFLAAFTCGITIASAGPEIRDAFERFGESITELLKLAGLLVFGALITPGLFADVSWPGYVFAGLALLVTRPASILVSLLRSPMPSQERVVAAWFGPKGFASVVFGLLILQADVTAASRIFHLVALVVVASILAHASTDVLMARWFERQQAGAPPEAIAEDTRAAPREAAPPEAATGD